MTTKKIRWTRSNRRIGKMVLNTVYESDCGRFTIEQRWSGGKITGYVLGFVPNPQRHMTLGPFRLLSEAKAAAPYIAKGLS